MCRLYVEVKFDNAICTYCSNSLGTHIWQVLRYSDLTYLLKWWMEEKKKASVLYLKLKHAVTTSYSPCGGFRHNFLQSMWWFQAQLAPKHVLNLLLRLQTSRPLKNIYNNKYFKNLAM